MKKQKLKQLQHDLKDLWNDIDHNRRLASSVAKELQDNYTANQLRKAVYEWDKATTDFGGRSKSVRKLSKKAHVYMIAHRVGLNAMVAAKNMLEDSPFNINTIRGHSVVEHAGKVINAIKDVEDLKPQKITAGDVNAFWTSAKTDEAYTVNRNKKKKEDTKKKEPISNQFGNESNSDLSGNDKSFNGSNSSGFDQLFTQMILNNIDLSSIFNPEQIQSMIHNEVLEEIKDVRQVEIEVQDPDGGLKKLGVQHKQFEDLLKVVSVRENVMMVGPTGSGKTYAAKACAEALDLDFHAISVGQQTSKVDLMGYMDENGNYVSTALRRVVEDGGVLLIDEIDSGNANVMTVLNAATANSICGFPDGMIKKHKDCVILAAANTYGRGADRQYVGRNQLDDATLDRFPPFEWDYDKKLEQAIASDDQWTNKVQKIRRIINDKNIRHIVSPRASIKGAKFLAGGLAESKIMDMLIWKGMNSSTKESIVAEL